ncbi:murein DD-endopeptidase MepM/ murein hydrolase activator NlpD [Stackebrandtia endophytica]|uniref:Murein DD-endopeptidase MepM/ murein hydrolase activator NlpD n=1 Tax=Stackebrandtia endophytica TaxID=1496996 RepID=A0A543B0E1_9ACTN|nr:M23 family metallopeptidase [Stackebrandtia endophytica]TQL78289.1 murein DD-endopeptidase MepM/ murein hydrolase activator NlpD [Stackebrandtia endophytica]
MRSVLLTTVAAAVLTTGIVAAPTITQADDPTTCVPAESEQHGIATFGYFSSQFETASTIHTIALERHLPERASLIAITASMADTGLLNQQPDDDADGVGIFGWTPSEAIGDAEQLSDPGYSAGRFFDRMVEVGGWQDMPPAQVARVVQGEAKGTVYAENQASARVLMTMLQGSIDCLPVVSPGEYTHPTPGVSAGGGFRTPDGPGHDGIDFSGYRGTPILAAGDGTVVTVLCNAHTADGAPYSCDVDGSPQVLGCGWYLEILHTDQTVTRYCHFESEPPVAVGERVSAGQEIGTMGSSGNSSGPHLHFETHMAYPAWPGTAVDPRDYLAKRGVRF